MSQETSLKCWMEEQEHFGEQELIVLKTIRDNQPCTDRIVSQLTGLFPSTVSARRRHLVQEGVVCEAFKDKCPVTGRTSIFWGVLK